MDLDILQINPEFTLIRTHFLMVELSILVFTLVLATGLLLFVGYLQTKNANLKLENENLKLKNKDLSLLASTDALTGLLNRKPFEVDFDRMLSLLRLREGDNRHNNELEGVELLFIDIDKFKAINDNFGHAIGDEVLRVVAEQLKKLTRTSDLVCRWGGEEIVIALANVKLTDSGAVAEKIREAVEKLTFSDALLSVTVSIGVAHTQYFCNASKLINFADKAMYQAKKSGRNQVCFYREY